MTDEPRDRWLEDALRRLPVPDHGPGFWDDLERRLAGGRAAGGVTPGGVTPMEPAGGAAGGQAGPISAGPISAGPISAGPISAGPISAGPAPREPISLEERRPPRRRSLLPAAAAVAVVLVGAATLSRWGDGEGRRVATTDRPGTGRPAPGTGSPETTSGQRPAPAPRMLSATYGWSAEPGQAERPYRLDVAHDGSYRWVADDGSEDVAYDAASGRAVERVPGMDRQDPLVTVGLAPGGPDGYRATPPPLLALAHLVSALGRAGDGRVVEGSLLGRVVWRYDGPIERDRLGLDSPDRAVAEVDRETGVLLSLRLRAGDGPGYGFTARSVETSERLDRSRFTPGPGPRSTTTDRGFTRRNLDQAAGDVPFPLLVPQEVPEGFVLEAVAVDRKVPSATGAEGLNPPVVPVVTLRWADGFRAFSVTLRPRGTEEWGDPFGAEGFVQRTEPVRLELPGLQPLEGAVVVDAPAPPHLWGITGDVVVTVDGPLSAEELQEVAASLRPYEERETGAG